MARRAERTRSEKEEKEAKDCSPKEHKKKTEEKITMSIIWFALGIFVAFLIPSPLDGWIKGIVSGLWSRLVSLFKEDEDSAG
jgi:hypothetical protein